MDPSITEDIFMVHIDEYMEDKFMMAQDSDAMPLTEEALPEGGRRFLCLGILLI